MMAMNLESMIMSKSVCTTESSRSGGRSKHRHSSYHHFLEAVQLLCKTYGLSLILGHGQHDAEQAAVGVGHAEAGGGERADVADRLGQRGVVGAPLDERAVAESCGR